MAGAAELNGPWLLRCNGTALLFLILEDGAGTLASVHSSDDAIKIDSYDIYGGRYKLAKIQFTRTGAYHQVYVGWVSTDRNQMTGYYYNSGLTDEKAPWEARAGGDRIRGVAAMASMPESVA